jgi:tetratricopeptide (TPR) repeat protein
MNSVVRAILLMGLLWCCSAVPRSARADDKVDAAEAKPSGTETPRADSKSEVPLEKLLERVTKLEKELLELRARTGRIPADKNDQRILALIETPYLGTVYGGGRGASTNQRFLALKVMLVNITDQPVTLLRSDVQLSVDGQDFPVKDAPEQSQYNGFQVGQQQMQLRNLKMPTEIRLGVGGTASSWMLFPELPLGNHIPRLLLKLKFGEKVREIDVNATQRDALGISVERIGPRASLGVITFAGALDTINVGSLVEETDRLAADKLARVVIRFKEGSSITDPQLTNWLQNAIVNLGRQQGNETQFPPLPASLREVHLAEFPISGVSPSTGGQMSNAGFAYLNASVGATGRVHKTEAEAVIAALRSAYESLPRDEVLQAIQTGNRFERAAALAGGGGRLPVGKLPLLLGLADDNDLVIQQAALLALSHFGEEVAIDKLLSYARKDVPALSAAAIAGLAASRYSAAHQALLELLKNEPPESKKNIVKILAAYPRPIWSDAIYEFVKDGRSGLNVEALQALVQVGHPRLVAVLRDALRDGDRNLSQTAIAVLVARSDRESEEIAVEYTLEQLKSTPATPVMLQLLNRVKDQRAVPLLMAQFPRHDNKTSLIQTLALLGDAETGKFLAEKYNTLQGHEKGEVLRVLARFDKDRFRQLSAQALLTADGSIINAAVQGLQEDGGPEAIRIMTDALDASPINSTWSYLCNALAQSGTPAARSALLRARDSENQEKRNYAVNALQILRQRSPGYQYISHAQVFSRDQKWQEAIEQFNLAIQLDPTLSDAYAERGHALLHLDKSADAGKDFAKALELDPYNSLALTGACLSMVMADGKHAEAIKKLEDSRARFPRNAMFLYNAACVYGRAFERVKKESPPTERDKLLEQYQQAALNDLKASIQNGFQEFELMKKDPDLAPFQELPEFQQLLAAPPPPQAGGRGLRNQRRAPVER